VIRSKPMAANCADPGRVRVCDGTDPYVEPRRTPPSMTVMRGLQGPFLKVITGEGEVTLTPVDIDTLLRLARQTGMVGGI
jgi:hypothetical protein